MLLILDLFDEEFIFIIIIIQSDILDQPQFQLDQLYEVLLVILLILVILFQDELFIVLFIVLLVMLFQVLLGQVLLVILLMLLMLVELE